MSDDDSQHSNDSAHPDSALHGHDLFMLRPDPQMEADGEHADKVLQLMWEDDDDENVFVKNTKAIEKWVSPSMFGSRRIQWRKKKKVVGATFQWSGKTGLFRTNKYICALAGKSLKQSILEMEAELAEYNVTTSWVGSTKPDLDTLDPKITLEFQLVRTTQSRHPDSVELVGDVYMFGDTQYLRSYMDLELQTDLNWEFVRSETPYWKLSRDERSKYPYYGSFKKVLDRIEQAAFSFSSKPTYRWMYQWSDDGNITRMTAAEMPQPQVEPIIILYLKTHTCRQESTETRQKKVIHQKPHLCAE